MLASLYQYIYVIIVVLITFSVMSLYNGWTPENENGYHTGRTGLLVFWVLFFIIAIGFRPISYQFVDMMRYHFDYEDLLGVPFSFSVETDNIVFDNIIPWLAANRLSERWFFLLISAIYFGCMAWACVKLFPNDALLAFVVCLGAFSTFSYGTNGIKAGAAASLFLLALAYREKKVLAGLFMLLSIGFHHSMLAPIVAYVIVLFYRNPKVYLIVWIISLVLAASHITFFQSLFAGFTDEHGASYLVVSLENNVSGFRPDFILYSAVPVFIGYHLIVKRQINSDAFVFMWCVYTLTNSVFLLCTYGSFINRIAYLSWLMYPIVLLYPFVNIAWDNYQKKYLDYVVYGHLAFTVFMVFIYYGLLSS